MTITTLTSTNLHILPGSFLTIHNQFSALKILEAPTDLPRNIASETNTSSIPLSPIMSKPTKCSPTVTTNAANTNSNLDRKEGKVESYDDIKTFIHNIATKFKKQ